MNKIIEALKFIYAAFLEESLLVQLIWLCIPIFFLLFFINIFLISIYRFRLIQRDKKETKYKKTYQNFTLEFIMTNDYEEEKKIERKVKKISANSYNRSLMLKIILALSSSVSGEYNEKLKKLYVNSGLIYYSYKKLKSRKWYVKIEGLRELTQLYIKNGFEKKIEQKIRPLVSHKNKVLKGEAYLALVQLKGTEGLYFLNDFKEELSEWQQIELLEALFKIRNIEFPYAATWLTSTNPSVVLFALKIVEVYSLIQYKSLLVELINYKDTKVRRRVIKILVKFNVTEAINPLWIKYEHEATSYFEKIELLDAIHCLQNKPQKLSPIKEDNKKVLISA